MANESVDPADGRFAPILLKKSISEGSRFLREGLVRSLGNYVGDLVIGSLFNERPIQGHCEATNSRRTISIYVSRKLLGPKTLVCRSVQTADAGSCTLEVNAKDQHIAQGNGTTSTNEQPLSA